MGTYAHIAPDDRIPTLAEIEGFDPAAAWDRLTPEQQREVGKRAVHYGTAGCVLAFVVHDRADVPLTYADWEAEQRIWPTEGYDRVSELENKVLNDLTNHLENLWPRLFGWTAPVLIAFALLTATVVNISAISGA